MDMFSKMIVLAVVVVFTFVIAGIAVSAFLGFQCYNSGDPNSMACYMISDRYEIGVRERK